MSWFLVGGAAIGAGVGSYGHDNWGWSKDAIWQGAAVGAGGGYLAGAAATPAATGAGSMAYGGAGAATAKGVAAAGPVAAGAGAKTASSFLTKPLISGVAGSNPLMLGAAGLTLASGFGSQGSAFQDKIELTKEGKVLEKDWIESSKKRLTKAKKGDVSDRAFQDISIAKTAEGVRARKAEGAINTIQATVGNQPDIQRGTMTVGGGFVKAQLADTGERMTGLFAPTSILNNYRKEELINSIKNMQNINNLENQTASFNYGSSLAKWGANQAVASEKGAAIGSTLAMFGNAQLNTAYLNQMAIA